MCFYVFMRTTVVLPPELLRLAKTRSAERGESLKTLLTRAIAAELGHASGDARTPRARVSLPLFGNPAGRSVRVTNAEIAAQLAADDAATSAPRGPEAPRSRRRRDASRR